jgi:acetyl-CoA carboxylase biotin carboxyl carrier protein
MAIMDVKAEIAGTVWKVTATVGDTVEEDDSVMILESMKMEIPVLVTEAGTITEILVEEGATVTEGTVVAKLEV